MLNYKDVIVKEEHDDAKGHITVYMKISYEVSTTFDSGASWPIRDEFAVHSDETKFELLQRLNDKIYGQIKDDIRKLGRIALTSTNYNDRFEAKQLINDLNRELS